MKLSKTEGEAQDETKAVQIHSMTSEITIYHVPSTALDVGKLSSVPCCVNIIDTPGFGDTRGPSKDAQIEQMLTQLLRTIPSFNYISVVFKASNNRLDP